MNCLQFGKTPLLEALRVSIFWTAGCTYTSAGWWRFETFLLRLELQLIYQCRRYNYQKTLSLSPFNTISWIQEPQACFFIQQSVKCIKRASLRTLPKLIWRAGKLPSILCETYLLAYVLMLDTPLPVKCLLKPSPMLQELIVHMSSMFNTQYTYKITVMHRRLTIVGIDDEVISKYLGNRLKVAFSSWKKT